MSTPRAHPRARGQGETPVRDPDSRCVAPSPFSLIILPSPADKRSVERIGEQLGALKSQITEDIKRNVLLRKEVLLVHKQPGFPGA